MTKEITITLKPTAKQDLVYEALWKSNVNTIFFGGAAGGGKSWIICESRLINAIRYPGYRSFIGREELKRLMQSTYVTWTKVCQHHKIPQTYWKLNGQYNYIEFTNGSRIDLLDLKYLPSDPLYERFGSLEYTDGAIEEAGEVNYLAFDVLKSRVNRHKNQEFNLRPTILITGNPKKNWTYVEFYKKWKENKLPEDSVFIQALYSDNPYTAKDYGQSLAQISDKVMKQRLMFGDWEYDNDQNCLMDFESIVDLFTNPVIEDDNKKYIIADIARYGRDTTTVSVWYGLVWKKTYVWIKQGIDQTAEQIRKLMFDEQIPYSHCLIDDDGIGCLTKGTEVFTTNGWKKVEDLSVKDKLYSKDDMSVIEADIASIKQREKTDIIELENGYSFSYSHFLPIRSRKEYKSILKSWDSITKKPYAYLENDFNWKGNDCSLNLDQTTIKMPNGGIKNFDNSLSIDCNNLATFLGWFVAEGCIDDKYIVISQSVKSIFNDEIRLAISNCGLKFCEDVSKNGEIRYRIGHKALQDWIENNCYAGDIKNALYKKCPDIIKNGSKDTINAFLEAFNHGDGYYHRGLREYQTSSIILSDDLQELILKTGKYSGIRIKHRQGSNGTINGRNLIRTSNNYVVYEWKSNEISIRPKIKKVYVDNVYDVQISGESKLFMVRFADKRPFWVHNGGVVDILRGTKGFINNSSPLFSPITGKPENYQNLKTQCAYTLADYVKDHKIKIEMPDLELKQKLIDEIEQIKSKDIDTDGKRKLMPKEEVKEILGRSPDLSDNLLMRMYFELTGGRSQTSSNGVRIIQANYQTRLK